MIPIPKRGILRKITGIEQAKSIAGIDNIEITAKLHYPLHTLPEGDGYLGFIFAYGKSPSAVENALRQSHSLLQFQIESEIMLEQKIKGIAASDPESSEVAIDGLREEFRKDKEGWESKREREITKVKGLS